MEEENGIARQPMVPKKLVSLLCHSSPRPRFEWRGCFGFVLSCPRLLLKDYQRSPLLEAAEVLRPSLEVAR